MHFKNEYRIPRPSYLAPALMPPVDPPGHASAHLLALCLKEVMSEAAFEGARPEADPPARLAERIARNREVLGLHYPCNSRAGRKLVQASFEFLKKCQSLQGLKGEPGVLQLAKDEWSLLWTPIIRRAAALVLAVLMSAATIEFGKIDAIGHIIPIALLIAIGPLSFHKSGRPRGRP